MKLTFRPLDRWDWPTTRDRLGWAHFKAPYSATLDLLDRELRMLGAESAVLQVDASERDCRLDGQLRADARPATPRVVLAFDSRHGPLKYHCDRFSSWQANLRAIALGLEALRKVERFGIGSRGEQYRGYTALPSGVALGPSTMTREDAAELLVRTAGPAWYGDGSNALADCTEDLLENPAELLPLVWKYAARVAHPDQGGDVEAFKRIGMARDLIRGTT